jgi:hypothetical protein
VKQTTQVRERATPWLERWAAICGLLESPPSLKPPGKKNQGNGYGSNGSVPAQLRRLGEYRFGA